MRALLAVGLVLAAPAIGADFRGTEFGSTCAAIEEREKALGSERIRANVSKGAAYQFNTRAFDRDVVIVYLCKDGVLRIGNYLFPKQRYDDAVPDYVAVYGEYSSAFGPPYDVYSRPGTQPVFPTVGTALPSEYFAYWRANGLYVRVDLVFHGDRAGDNWFVAVVISEDTK